MGWNSLLPYLNLKLYSLHNPCPIAWADLWGCLPWSGGVGDFPKPAESVSQHLCLHSIQEASSRLCLNFGLFASSWEPSSLGTGWKCLQANITFVKDTAKPRAKVTQPLPHLQGWSVIISHAWEHPEMWITPDISTWPEGHISQNPKKDGVTFLLGVHSKGAEGNEHRLQQGKFWLDSR